MPDRVLKTSDDVTVTSFLNESQQNFVFLFVISRIISVPSLSKIGQETKKLQKWERRHCDIISKNSSAIFVYE